MNKHVAGNERTAAEHQTAVAPAKERPILFNAPMVRAILDGRKTQTRRAVKPAVPADMTTGVWLDGLHDGPWGEFRAKDTFCTRTCPYGVPGDRLWVRESFQPLMADGIDERDWLSTCDYKTGKGYKVSYPATDGVVEFYDMANDEAFCNRVSPSIHMPRWASRLTLEVLRVRVERLQEISEDDCIAEGIEPNDCGDASLERGFNRNAYATLWDRINGPGAWDKNPWVWVVEFAVVSSQAAVSAKT